MSEPLRGPNKEPAIHLRWGSQHARPRSQSVQIDDSAPPTDRKIVKKKVARRKRIYVFVMKVYPSRIDWFRFGKSISGETSVPRAFCWTLTWGSPESVLQSGQSNARESSEVNDARFPCSIKFFPKLFLLGPVSGAAGRGAGGTSRVGGDL